MLVVNILSRTMIYFTDVLTRNNSAEQRRSTALFSLFIFVCYLLAPSQCQLNAASAQVLADFRSTSPRFAALFPLDDVCTKYTQNFFCSQGDIVEMRISARLDGSMPNSIGSLPLNNLDLSFTYLTGTIPESLAQTNAYSIVLENNLLEGTIPVGIFSNPNRGRIILGGNRFTGTLPDVSHNLITVYLQNNLISGTLPEAFTNSSNLEFFSLKNNKITGTVPNAWSPAIQSIDLGFNYLTGSIPEKLFQIPLGALLLNGNQLSGTLPPSFSTVLVVQIIELSTNMLTGTIPPILPGSRTMQIELEGNRFTGDLPFINSTKLLTLDVSNNLLDGTISDLLGDHLTYFQASNNKLTGSLSSLAQVTTLVSLNLAFNRLNGTLDPLYNLTSLMTVDVSSNYFSGVFKPNPNWKIGSLIISRNYIEGTFPNFEVSLGSFLQTLDFSFNRFSGPIPESTLDKLLSLMQLKLQGNGFTGVIPNFTKASNLQELDISNNAFEGTIPSSLSNLLSLRTFAAANNRLEGTLPDILGSFGQLNEIDLQFNKLSGTLPNSLTSLKYLISMKLNSNKFSGTIPTAMSQMSSLQVLQLNSNNFEGTIPNELGSLAALTQLSLDSNYLEGTIPSTFENFRSLASLTLQNNLLSGAIPNSFNTLINLKQLNLANNKLMGYFEPTVQILECNLAGNNLCCGDQTVSACQSSPPCSGPRKIVGQNETISFTQQYQYLEVPSGSTLLVDLTSDLHAQCLRVNGEIGLSVPAAQVADFRNQLTIAPITFTHTYIDLSSGSMTVVQEEKCREYSATKSQLSSTNSTTGQLVIDITTSNIANCSDLSEAAIFALAFTLGIGLPLIVALTVVIVLWRKGRFRRNIRQQVSMDIMNSLADKSFLTPSSSLKLDRELGAGSFGKVYVGKWQQTQVAFKFCNVPSKMDEFLREAALMMKLTPHPNVVQLLAISIDGPEPVIVLEYCDGGSLDNLLFDSNHPISDEEKIRIASGIARGMLHLHRHNIVHRDLAARNVLMQKGTPKVSDFGMSRLLQVNQESKTYSNVGPIRWMAPESLRDRVNTPKSDVWMYGIVLTEIITQTEPHIAEDVLAIGTKIRDQGLIPALPDQMHPLLSQLVSMCLKMNADERPDFESICQHIDQYCGANGITLQ